MILNYGNLNLLGKMKYLILLLGLIAYSTPKTNTYTQELLDLSKTKQTLKQSDLQSNNFFSMVPIVTEQEEVYLPFVGILKDEFVNSHSLNSKFKIGSQTGRVITIYARLDQIRNLENLEELEILKLSEKVDPPNIAGAITDSRVSYVHNAYNLDSAYTGEGVLLGIIDGGFDYIILIFTMTILINIEWLQPGTKEHLELLQKVLNLALYTTAKNYF